jgi:hypothetical protein
MAKPTEEADNLYNLAAQYSSLAEQAGYGTSEKVTVLLAKAVYNLAKGLQHTNTGLRATYILLEEFKSSLQRQGR